MSDGHCLLARQAHRRAAASTEGRDTMLKSLASQVLNSLLADYVLGFEDKVCLASCLSSPSPLPRFLPRPSPRLPVAWLN